MASRTHRPIYYRVDLRVTCEEDPFVLLNPTQAQAILLPHRARCEGRAILHSQLAMQATLLPHRTHCEGRAILRGRLMLFQ
jgi:hypothetical protein